MTFPSRVVMVTRKFLSVIPAIIESSLAFSIYQIIVILKNRIKHSFSSLFIQIELGKENDQNECDKQRSYRYEKLYVKRYSAFVFFSITHYFSFSQAFSKQYPYPRRVTIFFPYSPIFFLNRVIFTSIVRSNTYTSSLQTRDSISSREKT